jgi:hypothetical protein
VQRALALDSSIQAEKDANLKLKQVTLALQIQRALQGVAGLDLYLVAGGSIEKTHTAVLTLTLCEPDPRTGQCAAATSGLSQYYQTKGILANTKLNMALGKGENEEDLPLAQAIVAAAKATQLAYCGTPQLTQSETDVEFDFEVTKTADLGLDIKVLTVSVTGTATLTHEAKQSATFAFLVDDKSKPIPCPAKTTGAPKGGG